jgi:3-hydroxyacyl-CoA dehydrogenase
MGGGIAMSFAAAGLPVMLIDVDDTAIGRGMDRIRRNYATSVERGSISAAEAEHRIGLISTATHRTAAVDADLVIEAVFEDMELKQDLFHELEAICRADAVLATNTSALDVDVIATVLDTPGRFVGMHFFSPANVMKLCEIVRTDTTDADTLATAFAVAKGIAKVPVLARNCDGFIGNRIVARRSAQAERLLQEGALPQDVDEAIRAFGFPMGPLQTNDMSGLDVGYAIRKRRGTKFHIADAIVEAGRLGQKTGAGYYRYEPGSRTPIPDPETTRVIESVSASLGLRRREIPRKEMVERMIFALINEGARIVEEGIAARPSDVDVVWVYGYGFPRWRGGPLAYADEIGPGYIVERLDTFADRTGDETLAPAPLLRDLAEKRMTFSQWQKDRA